MSTTQGDDSTEITRRDLLLGGALAAGGTLLAPSARAQDAPPGAAPPPAARRIVILGAGFGGLETATGLGAALRDGWEITLVDRSDSFFVGFSKLDVLFGRRSEAQARYPYADLRARSVRFVRADVTGIDTDVRTVATSAGSLPWDYLVVALGADLDPAATPGFQDSGGHEFYSMSGAVRLRPVIEAFQAGTLVLGILGAPYKCPPAPYEAACQLHDLFVKKGLRARIGLKVVIPGPRPVPNPGVSDALERLLAERGIELVAGVAITSVDAARRQVVHAGGTIPYDLFVGVPVHVAPAVVRASKLGDGGFLAPDPATLETRVPNVYAIGDVTRIPAGPVTVPMAGSFAEDAARTVVAEILAKEGRGGGRVKFCARGACWVEVGGGLVARLNADFLGGAKPTMAVEGPTPELRAEKADFEATRRERWFAAR